jgi:membrane-associated phospholipid phosphatase
MQAERMTEPITGGPAIARQLWVVACAPLVVVPIAQLALDESVARWAHARELVSSAFLQWSTELGESTYWLVPAAVLFVICATLRQHNRARWAFFMFVAVGGSGLLANLLKFTIGKARPKLLLAEEYFGFKPFTLGYDFNSMPSGHATTCGAVAMVFAIAFPRWRWLFLLLGVALASTRIAIHAHYLSDVAAGLSLGMVFALISITVWRHRWPTSVPVAALSFSKNIV